MHYMYVENLKSTTSTTVFQCFLKHDVRATLYILYGSVFTVIDFAIFTENALYVFKILSILLAIPATCV